MGSLEIGHIFLKIVWIHGPKHKLSNLFSKHCFCLGGRRINGSGCILVSFFFQVVSYSSMMSKICLQCDKEHILLNWVLINQSKFFGTILTKDIILFQIYWQKWKLCKFLWYFLLSNLSSINHSQGEHYVLFHISSDQGRKCYY